MLERKYLNNFKCHEKVWWVRSDGREQVAEVLTAYVGADSDDEALVRCCVRYWDGTKWVQTGMHVRDLLPKY